jgi:hypothetical protein
MRGVSTELLYLFAFLAIGLLRYLWDRLRRVQPWEERLARQQRAEAEAAAAPGPAAREPGAQQPALPPSAAPEAGSGQAPRSGEARRSQEAPARDARPVALPAQAPRLHEVRTHEARLREARLRAGHPVPASVTAPGRRRFSRRALFGDRRRTQDAVVAATILGPCRAFEPYDGGR